MGRNVKLGAWTDPSGLATFTFGSWAVEACALELCGFEVRGLEPCGFKPCTF